MSYSYYEALKADALEYINNEVDLSNWYGVDPDYLKWDLEEMLVEEDSITGNASGSYTFSRAKAKEYVLDNINLLGEVRYTFGISAEEIGKKFLDEDWEWMDVMIRCYLLSEVISDIVDDLHSEHAF